MHIRNTTTNRKFLGLYVKNSKPQYKSWNKKKIIGLKIEKLEKVDDFVNIYFKVVR